MHRGQTPPASDQRCDSRGMLWLQMKGEQSQCPEEQSGLRRVVRPKAARRLSGVGGGPGPGRLRRRPSLSLLHPAAAPAFLGKSPMPRGRR